MSRPDDDRRRSLTPASGLRREVASIMVPERQRARIYQHTGELADWGQLAIAVDLAVEFASLPTSEERAALWQVWRRCSERGAQDRLASIRTGAVRLLCRDPEPNDLGSLLEVAATYVYDAQTEVAGEIRGLALRAVAELDLAQARWSAATLLFDGAVPNDQPHRTAVNVLCRSGDEALLRHWLDSWDGPWPVEAAGDAEAELARVMPAPLWSVRAAKRLGDDRAVETLAAVDAVLAVPRPELAGALRDLLLSTRSTDLFTALAMALAASREGVWQDLLLDLVDACPVRLLPAYLQAVELSRDHRRDAVARAVSARLRSPG